MSKQDDRLEEKLIALEKGVQPENAKDGSSNSSELKSLANLATSIRDLPHPELDQQTIHSEKRRLISAAREKNRASQNSRATKSSGFAGLWLFVPAVAGVALIVLMVFGLAAGAGLYFSGPSGAQTAVLTDAIGGLEVSDTGFANDWQPVTNGDRVRAGQRLRTGDESWVTLEFFDGTQTTLSPNTDLVLNKIDGDWGNELQVELIQNEGETNHKVIPLQGDQANYKVFTPSGEASVRGTSFKVLVEDTGMSLFTVETGEVLVSNDGFETYLAAGQGVVTELGEELASPTFLFALQGVLEDNSGKTWQVEGVKFTVKGGTRIYDDVQKDDRVLVNGRITKKNEWIADSIQSEIKPGYTGGTFTGVVTSAGADGLSINGYPFTVIGPMDVAVGDLVRVTFTIDGDDWTVDTLEILDGVQEPDQDDSFDDATDQDTDIGEVLFFSREEYEITDCAPVAGSMREFTTTLNYVPVGDDPQSLEVELTLSENSDELKSGSVDSITISLDGTIFELPHSITLLPDSDPIDLVVIVTLGADSLPPETKLEIQVVATEVTTDTVGDEPLSTTFKIEWVCDEEVLYFSLEEFEITDCGLVAGSMREFTTTLNYVPVGDDPQSLKVELTLSENSDELKSGSVDSITISLDGTIFELPHSITLLPDSDPIDLVVIVTLGADSLPPGSKLEIQVVATEVVSGTPVREPLSATFKIEWDCDGEEEPKAKESHYCTTADLHPKGLKLEGQGYYNADGVLVQVEYSQIMDWFCNYRFGFGEIDLMLALSRGYTRNVYEIFDKRQEGYGWGQIKHHLAAEAIALQTDGELTIEETKKEPPGKQKSEDAKNKEKPNKKNKNDD